MPSSSTARIQHGACRAKAECRMPDAKCRMPNAECRMPNTLCRIAPGAGFGPEFGLFVKSMADAPELRSYPGRIWVNEPHPGAATRGRGWTVTRRQGPAAADYRRLRGV